MREGETKKN